jgi:hypothetical protein
MHWNSCDRVGSYAKANMDEYNEHDDDLESEVIEDSEEEKDTFPDIGDQLDDAQPAEPDDEAPLDDDEAEL